MPAPSDIKARKGDQVLAITWPDGVTHEHGFVALRGHCACASCVDEWTGKPLLDPATIPADLSIASVELVGNYALKIVWTDGHDTGLYTWDRLRQIGEAM